MNEMNYANVVEVYPTDIWYEKDMFGTVSIKMQHKGMEEPFTFIRMHYDYYYTNNLHQHNMVKAIGKLLGVEDIEERLSKKFAFEPEVQEKIEDAFSKALKELEKTCPHNNRTEEDNRTICRDCGKVWAK